jgi:hypothetical protein
MGFFTDTRLHFGNLVLAKKASRFTRKPYYRNFFNVRNIGIVWDASKIQEFPVLSRFHQKMHDRNIDVTVIGYYPGKELPDQYTAIRFLTCLRKEEVNFFYLPVSAEADKFTGIRFDILIDINFDNIFPLACVTVLSKAGFKVGLLDTKRNSDIFDLMMELKKPVNVEEYLTQVILYLEMINSESTVKAETI